MSVTNTEFKSVDTQSELAITDTPQIRLINALQKGDDFNNRDGRSVRFKSVQLKWTVQLNPLNTLGVVRCMVVIDKQANATLMTIGDLLDETHTNSFKNLNFRKRFVILKDETITLQDSGEKSMHINWYKKLDMITIYDDSDTGGISDITTNALYLVIFSDQATNGLVQDCHTRVRFVDN